MTEKHASVEYQRFESRKLWAKPEALKIVCGRNVKVVWPHYWILEMERSHITKAEIGQRRSEVAERRREQERGLFLAVRIGRQKLLEATPLHAAQLAAVGSSSSRL